MNSLFRLGYCAAPSLESKGMIPVPEYCSNLVFGGTDGKTLYLTCRKKVYQLAMQVRGGQPEAKPTR